MNLFSKIQNVMFLSWDNSSITILFYKRFRVLPYPSMKQATLFVGGLNSSDNFTTKSATWVAHGIKPHDSLSWSYKWIWNIDTVPKIKIFIWQICHKVLPVRGTLLRRALVINPACPLCLGDIESTEHIFKDCQMVHKVWDLAAKHRWLPSTISPPGC